MTLHSHRLFTWTVLCALLVLAPLPLSANAAAQGQPPMGYLPMLLIYERRAPTTQSDQATLADTYTVRPGDTLRIIAERFGVSTASLIRANNLADPDTIVVGQRLAIPSATGDNVETPTAPAPTQDSASGAAGATAADSGPQKRGTVEERLTYAARTAPPDSPFYNTTWVTFYGRPGVPVMGILGEYSIDDLVPRLHAQARAYAAENGSLRVMPAFHLIYGMASTGPGDDGSHLVYLSDDVVKAYIQRAQQEGFGVILDVQIGALTPLASILPAFPYLAYRNVQLALDPEFAMTTDGQTIPGQPPGMITANQVNRVQATMSNYMQQAGIGGRRMLIVHQFLPSMIDDTAGFYVYNGVDLAICADGYGPAWPKISKYNLFMDPNVRFTGFKLFYQWDEPLLTERQVLGIDPYTGIGYIETTPNLIVYQ
jgi:murein DD-endopeptidase MepM/ murein hydrolase activator NlpD